MREIAEIKLKDLEGVSLESAMHMVEGTARSMGVTVVDWIASGRAASRTLERSRLSPPRSKSCQSTANALTPRSAKVDRMQYYEPAQAVELVKEAASAKFDETVEVHLRMGVDPRYSDQQVRGVVTLPNGTGRTVRILVFAGPDGQALRPRSRRRFCRRRRSGRTDREGLDRLRRRAGDAGHDARGRQAG